MSDDAVVVGAGLAGLVSALRLAEAGRRVLVLARGLGATHLAPPTIDVLGYAPERVEDPGAALAPFAAAHPGHPYERLTAPLVGEAIAWLAERVPSLGFTGGLEQNFLLPTGLGVAKPSAAVPKTMVGGDLRTGGRFLFVGFRALKDFYPGLLADNLAEGARGAVSARAVELPADEVADTNSLGLARRLEDAGFRARVAGWVRERLEPGERVGFPAALGLRASELVWRDLEQRLDAPVFEVPTLPPSVPGIRLYDALREGIRGFGGRVVIGGRAIGADVEGGRVAAVVVQTAARPRAHRAEAFVLATGGFAGGGLELDSRGVIRETVFGLPVSGVPEGGRPRFVPGLFDEQPLARAGLAVDDALRPVGDDGRAVFDNLHAAGATLAGAEPWREASGNGIALASGYFAASAILAGTP